MKVLNGSWLDFVEDISIKFDPDFEKLLKPVGLNHIFKNSTKDSSLTIRGHKIALKNLL